MLRAPPQKHRIIYIHQYTVCVPKTNKHAQSSQTDTRAPRARKSVWVLSCVCFGLTPPHATSTTSTRIICFDLMPVCTKRPTGISSSYAHVPQHSRVRTRKGGSLLHCVCIFRGYIRCDHIYTQSVCVIRDVMILDL